MWGELNRGKKLPQYPEGELEKIDYSGTTCEALFCQHAVARGLFVVVSLLIIMVSLAVGVCYSRVGRYLMGHGT